MKSISTFFTRSYLSLFYCIIFGTTLFFSTATRSVFEVNKLGIVKISLSLLGIIYFYDRLIGKKEWFFEFNKNKTFNRLIILVWVSNLFSTIFSKNIMISIFGCYDRWEGLITVSFYLFMMYLIINVKGIDIIKKLILGVIIATGLSSLYGIVQSFGVDIINWSLDPSKRVFGSINNPVHYCAIMGMCIPVIIGQLFNTVKDNNITKISWKSIALITSYYLGILLFLKVIFPQISTNIIDPLFSDTTNTSIKNRFSNSYWQILSYVIILGAPYAIYLKNAIKNYSHQNTINMLYNSLILTIYTTYLSYSRATWLGLTSAIALILIITLINSNVLKKRDYGIFCFGLLLFSALYYLIFLFNIHQISSTIMIISFLFLSTAVLLIIIPLRNYSSAINFVTIVGLISYQFLIQHYLSIVILLGLTGIITFQKYKQKQLLDINIFLFIIIFMNIQFISISVIHFVNFVILVIALIITENSSSLKNPFSTNIIFKWKLIIIAIFSMIFISPNIYIFATSQNNETKNSQMLVKQAQNKINSYKSIAIQGSARTSMWKSSVPWFLDHFLIGSGLDTIKYYYPKYRRPEYGKLEGGHNYTPDRLHNEYLNTLATKGIIGFTTYYVIFLGFIFSSLIFYIHNESVKNRFLIIGLLGGALVYLGQVLFNFGVVATLVFFYLFLSLSYGLKSNEKTT